MRKCKRRYRGEEGRKWRQYYSVITEIIMKISVHGNVLIFSKIAYMKMHNIKSILHLKFRQNF